MSKLLQVATAQDFQNIRGVCLDIDDTLSTEGKLTARAYSALWDLKNAGFFVIPITGRPSGWCDHIARFWPVNAVVGENGAFCFYMKDGKRARIDTPEFLKSKKTKKLSSLQKQLKKKWPKLQFASDQAYREADLAIDFCEDVKPWSEREVDEVTKFCKKAGAEAKISSIHINTWFGKYDKRKGFENLLRSKVLPELPNDKKAWAFIGDSPNDEPLFEYFPISVGVANLSRFLKKMQCPPVWMATSKSGDGFEEFAKTLLRLTK